MATLLYNRSEVYSFFDLPLDAQNDLSDGCDSEEIQALEEASYVRLDYTNGPRYHSLAECVRTGGGRFDGVIGVSNTCAIGIKFSKCGTGALVALIG